MRLCGVGVVSGVLVTFGFAGVDSSRASGSTSSFNPLVVYHYAIGFAVTASQQNTDYYTDGNPTVWSNAVQWSGSWKDVKILVAYAKADDVVSVAGEANDGTLKNSEQFAYNDPPSVLDPTDCMGTVAPQTYTDGRVAVSSAIGFAEVNPEVNSFLDDETTEIDDDCGPNNSEAFANPYVFAFVAPDGVKFTSLSLGGVSWSALGPGTHAFPISDLVAHKSFIIEGGQQSELTAGVSCPSTGQCSGSVKESVTVTFKFLRGGANKPSPGSGGSGNNGSGGGATLCHVPALDNLTVASARVLLKADGCSLGKVTTSGGSPGTLRITAQSPRAGVTRPYGSRVDVTVG